MGKVAVTGSKWEPLEVVTAQLGLKEWAESGTVPPGCAAQVCGPGVGAMWLSRQSSIPQCSKQGQ